MSCNKILCKDGGFSSQLSKHVEVGTILDGDPLWSARFNLTNPDAVIKTHLDFLNAGADTISTNTYQASLTGYKKHLNVSEDECIELIKNAVKFAHTARDKYYEQGLSTTANGIKNDTVLIMGSIGPYGATLHDASEYTGDYADKITSDELKKWHKSRIDAILEVGVDALAIETIPCQIEAEALVDLLLIEYPNVKFWISLQCKNEKSLAHGESFADVVSALWSKIEEKNATDKCMAIGANCLHPKYVTSLFKAVNEKRSNKIPLIVYANSGELYDTQRGWYGSEDCIPLDHYCREWIELGTKIIGGCCRVYARDIERIKETIEKLCRT